jgi:hypothetical protein
MTRDLKDLVQGTSEFQYYRDSQLWYKTQVGEFLFPVPIEDIGNATFSRFEKSLLLMRYIRKHLKTLEVEQNERG